MENKADLGCFKEAVCIDAARIYDSCSDKDCLEDLRCYFTDCSQSIIDSALSIRNKKAEVITVYLDVEPVPFNRGYYTIDLTFFFDIKLDVFTSPVTQPTTVDGLCIFNKKVVLYGSEGNVQIFSSDYSFDENDTQNPVSGNLPKAICQVAEPVALAVRMTDCPSDFDSCHCKQIPKCIQNRFDGDFTTDQPNRLVFVTIGLFTIVQIERNVQMLVPVYDFCIPEKECVSNADDPCDLFKKIKFPTNQFFPPRQSELINAVSDDGDGCGCSRN